MVALAPTSLPPLAEDTRALLLAYRAAAYNLDALAAALHTDPLTAAARLADPNVAAWLNHLDELEAREHQTRTRALKLAAQQALAALIDSTEDPIEKRRAATALLRSLSPGYPLAPRGASSSPPTPSRGAGVPPASSQPSSSPTSQLRDSQTPDLPAPATKPTYTLSVPAALTAVLESLRTNDTPRENTGLATLAAFLCHTCTVNGEALDSDALADDTDDLGLTPLINHTTHRITDITTTLPDTAHITVLIDDKPFTFTLGRQTTAWPYEIRAIDTG